MGDRVIVVFEDEHSLSPGIYLHWHGEQVRSLLQEAVPRLRAGDATYSAARFCGVCHTKIDGNLSLGLFEPPATREDARGKYGHGDAGVIIVNTVTGECQQVGGYNDGTFRLPTFPDN